LSVAPQFAVYRSPSKCAAKPFVIVVQSNDFQRMPTRVVAPLVPASALPGIGSLHPRVAPLLLIKGRSYRLNPLDMATLGVQRLGDYVSSFADDEEARRRIQDALDIVQEPL
jgi:hypothetical protein